MKIKEVDNWRERLTGFIEDDMDGGFWFEDRIEEVLRDSRDSRAFAEYLETVDNPEEISEESYSEGYDVGYEQGYEDATDQQFVESYNQGYDDAKAGRVRQY